MYSKEANVGKAKSTSGGSGIPSDALVGTREPTRPLTTRASSRTRAPVYKSPPAQPADIQALHDIAAELQKVSFNAAWMPFLAKYQEVLDVHQPRLMNVCPTPITWKDAQHCDREAGTFPEEDFTDMLTLRDWIDTDAPRGHAFSLAVMTTPIVGPVKYGREYMSSQDWHIWVLMTAHAPPGSKGKTLITYDSDVMPHHNKSREREALTFEYTYVQYIRGNKAGRLRAERVGPPSRRGHIGVLGRFCRAAPIVVGSISLWLCTGRRLHRRLATDAFKPSLRRGFKGTKKGHTGNFAMEKEGVRKNETAVVLDAMEFQDSGCFRVFS
ncbi:hypothetical protein B0H13DRAFT_1850879 [Mycena leptocephala]|nr:hypothetical protein B0H13DRAFT_1850879 [Mycena leptocephala]